MLCVFSVFFFLYVCEYTSAERHVLSGAVQKPRLLPITACPPARVRVVVLPAEGGWGVRGRRGLDRRQRGVLRRRIFGVTALFALIFHWDVVVCLFAGGVAVWGNRHCSRAKKWLGWRFLNGLF